MQCALKGNWGSARWSPVTKGGATKVHPNLLQHESTACSKHGVRSLRTVNLGDPKQPMLSHCVGQNKTRRRKCMPANIKHRLWMRYPQTWRPRCSPVPYRELWKVCVGVISFRNLSPTGSKTGWTKLLKDSFCACTGSLWTAAKLCPWYHVSSTKLEYFTGSWSSCMFTSSCIVAEPSLIPAIVRVMCGPWERRHSGLPAQCLGFHMGRS